MCQCCDVCKHWPTHWSAGRRACAVLSQDVGLPAYTAGVCAFKGIFAGSDATQPCAEPSADVGLRCAEPYADVGLQAVEPVQFSARMDGLLGHVAGHAQLSDDGSGKPCAVVSLAAGESFPDGLLQDAKVHWGTCLHEESGWDRPPQGWKASPEGSQEAGAFCAADSPLHGYVSHSMSA